MQDNAENIPEELKESLQKVGQAVYSQSQAGAAEGAAPDGETPTPPGSEGSGSSDDDNTVEGEFREV